MKEIPDNQVVAFFSMQNTRISENKWKYNDNMFLIPYQKT